MPKAFTMAINFRNLRARMKKINLLFLYLLISQLNFAYALSKDTCTSESVGFSANASFIEEQFDKEEIKRNISVEDISFAWAFSFSKLSQDSPLRYKSNNTGDIEKIIYTNFSKLLEEELFLTIISEKKVDNKYKIIETQFENNNRTIFIIKLEKYKSIEYFTKLIITTKNNKSLSRAEYKKVDNFFSLCTI